VTRALFAIASLAWIAGVSSVTGQQTFRGGVQVVLIDASVVRDRAPLTGLQPADFVVTDNGVRQRVEAIDTATMSLDVSLVVDATWFTSGVVDAAGGLPGDILRRNARQIAAQLRPDDRLEVIAYAEDVVETRPMSAIADDSVQVSSVNSTSAALTYGARVGQALLTAITAPVSPDRRHFVVVFAAARDVLDIPDPAYLVRVASRSDALLHAVLNPTRQTYDSHQPLRFPSEELIRNTLTRAAEATGGKAYLTGDIVGAFRDALKAFRSSYVLRYTLDGVPAAGWHDIVVKVPRCPTCTIQARRGYMGQ
jgi:VWFA-related protein